MLSKNYNQERKTHFDHEKNIKKDRKKTKKDTFLGIVFTDPQMRKKVIKPIDSVLCGSWRPEDYNSPHIQSCQQFLIKDLTISDSHCSLKFT